MTFVSFKLIKNPSLYKMASGLTIDIWRNMLTWVSSYYMHGW